MRSGRGARVVWDFVLEDTQRFEAACERLALNGLPEARMAPIQDAA
jgi:hypothetical protein